MRKYHFSYDEIESDGQSDKTRKELIKFFLYDCECSDIDSYNASSMIIDSEKNYDYLKSQIIKYLNPFFYNSFSKIAQKTDETDLIINYPDDDISKRFRKLVAEVKKEGKSFSSYIL